MGEVVNIQSRREQKLTEDLCVLEDLHRPDNFLRPQVPSTKELKKRNRARHECPEGFRLSALQGGPAVATDPIAAMAAHPDMVGLVELEIDDYTHVRRLSPQLRSLLAHLDVSEVDMDLEIAYEDLRTFYGFTKEGFRQAREQCERNMFPHPDVMSVGW